jgi:hypothetical protein
MTNILTYGLVLVTCVYILFPLLKTGPAAPVQSGQKKAKPVPASATPKKRACPACGTSFQHGDKFCAQCGKKL